MADVPRVSIVIPTYTRIQVLEKAIASVFGQTYVDWELIVVDDGSRDDTVARVESHAAADRRVRVVRNELPRGAAGARNHGIAQARGEFVAFLDSDDLWYPEHLGKVLAHFEADPDVDMVGSNCWRVDRRTGERKTASGFLLELIGYWEELPAARRLLRGDEIRRDLLQICDPERVIDFVIGGFLWVQTSTIVIRRRVFDAIGTFDESLRRTEDYDFWLRVNGSGHVGFVAEPLGEIDVTGQDEMEGDRYEGYDAERATGVVEEHLAHIDLLRELASPAGRARRGWGGEWSSSVRDDRRAFLRHSLRIAHREIAHVCGRRQPLRAALHYAKAARYRPKDVVYFLRHPRRFLADPY